MAGHVNMMDDVLISNLPSNIIRSSLRVLISQGASTQQPFIKHVRSQLQQTPLELLGPEILFPNPTSVSPECREYLALTRCLFSSKLAVESLIYIKHFVDAITRRQAVWEADSELHDIIIGFGGDVIQAVQALKESRPQPSTELEGRLDGLIQAFDSCKVYCDSRAGLSYPFARAERQVQDVMALLFPDRPQCKASSALEPTIAVALPEDSSSIETFQVGQHLMPRLFNGLWQLSSSAWGSSSAEAQEQAMSDLVKVGLIAADMADHYGDAELIYGDFRNKLSANVRDKVYAATKWCIFAPLTEPVTYDWVLNAVKERSRRLSGRVELLQFHWHDYGAKDYLEILRLLVKITEVHPELVSAIGLCNFDSEHVEEICTYLLSKDGKVGIVSNQVQFSLFDSRPLQRMTDICDRYGLKLLTYGSFCGGFLSSRWLGQASPDLYSSTAQLTPSARKYYDIISAWGSWQDFQVLLETLSIVASKYHVSLTNVATRWVLQQPCVGAVIVGTRLGVSSHGDENLKVFQFHLDTQDMGLINARALGPDGQKAKAMFEILGDCGNEYRAMK